MSTTNKFKFRSKFNYSARAIRAMSQSTRENLYNQEKDELFMQIRDLPAEEVAAAHRELAKKWGV